MPPQACTNDRSVNQMHPIQTEIETRLVDALSPEFLEVVNESGNHNVPAGSESHFKVTVVAATFEGRRLIERHRLINELLAPQLAGEVHAVAMHTYTAAEWQARFGAIPDSPLCRGGS